MKGAYEAELASTDANTIKEGQKMEIEFRVFDDQSEVTIDLYNRLNNVFKRAGTEIGLDLSIKLVKDEDYYNSAKRGNFDMIFSTWGGAAINPWNLMQVYLDKDFDGNCEYGFAKTQDKVNFSIDVNGDGEITADETRSYHNWYQYLNDTLIDLIYDEDTYESMEEFNEAYAVRHNQRLNILAGLEAGILSRFQAIPLYARNSADIMSFKVEYITKQYINLIGYGGIRFMKFNYDDAQWANLISTGRITYDSYKN
jgi:oligopeptide transport system substrate-binding protein